MEWLEKAIAAISPQRAYMRRAWRQELERSYDAADGSRYNQAWRAVNQSAENEDRPSRDIIRARARDLERNSDIMKSILSAYRRNVVGYGYTLQAQTGDDAVNERLESLWKQWCKAEHCDVTGDQSMVQLARMALNRKKVDGGILIRKCYSGDWIVPLQLQALEVDELDVGWAKPNKKGNQVVAGVEYNSHKKAVGYWVKQYQLNGWDIAKPEFVPADRMIFLWSKSRPSQVREISDMAATATRIRDINEYLTAVAVKERMAACTGLIVKSALPTGGFGRSSAPQAGQSDYAGKKIVPGMVFKLNAGDDVEVVDPSGTGDDATIFAKLQISMIAAGQGLSYETMSRDMHGSTYSSARQGAIEDELTYIEEKELLMELYTKVYESFVSTAVLSGAVDIPDFFEDPQRWLKHDWAERPKPWVDPEKEANANAKAVQTLQKTFKDFCAENGADWRTVIDDTAEAITYAQGKGVNLFEILYQDKGSTGQSGAGEAAGGAEPEQWDQKP